MKRLVDNLFEESRVAQFVVWVLRYRVAIVTVSLLVTTLAVWILSGIGLDSSLTALLPKDTPSVQRLAKIKEKVGGFGDLMVMVESPEPTKSMAYAEALLPKVRALPWVDRASFSIDDTVFRQNKLLYIDLVDLEEIESRVDNYVREQKIRRSPFFFDFDDEPPPQLDFSDIEERYNAHLKGRIVNLSEDGKVLLLVLFPSGLTSDISFARSIFEDLERLIASHDPRAFHSDMRVSIGGTYRNRLDEYDTIIADVESSALWACLGILLLLLLYFRRRGAIVVLAVPLAMSLAWTFALTRLVIGNLNLITAFLVIILFGLGIDFGIHMLTRYFKARSEGAVRDKALTTMINRAGRASFTAAATTASAFCVLMFSDFLGFRHFGFIAGTGIILAFVAFLVVFPATLAVAEDMHLLVFKLRQSLLASTRNIIPQSPRSVFIPDETENIAQDASRDSSRQRLRRPYVLILAGASLLTLMSLASLFEVEFEYNFKNLRSQVQRTRDFNRKMRKVFERARDPAVVLVADERGAAQVTRHLRDEIIPRPGSPVADVKSLTSFLPANQEQKLAIIDNIKRTVDENSDLVSEDDSDQIEDLKELLEVSSVTALDLPHEVTRPFLGVPNSLGQLVYVYQRHSLLDLRAARIFASTIGELEIDGKRYFPISEPIIYVELMRLLQRDALVAVSIAFAALFLLVFLDLQNLRAAWIVLTPVAVGVLWMLGVMAAYGIKLSIFNMVVLPSILGLGVDAAVHIYHRFEEHGAAGIRVILLETGGASFVSTATTMIGFGGLLSALHPGLRSIGILAIIGMGTCLLASLTLLPSLLMVAGHRSR